MRISSLIAVIFSPPKSILNILRVPLKVTKDSEISRICNGVDNLYKIYLMNILIFM